MSEKKKNHFREAVNKMIPDCKPPTEQEEKDFEEYKKSLKLTHYYTAPDGKKIRKFNPEYILYKELQVLGINITLEQVLDMYKIKTPQENEDAWKKALENPDFRKFVGADK